jgi:hypothetical protein
MRKLRSLVKEVVIIVGMGGSSRETTVFMMHAKLHGFRLNFLVGRGGEGPGTSKPTDGGTVLGSMMTCRDRQTAKQPYQMSQWPKHQMSCHVTPHLPRFWWCRISPQDMMKSMPEHMKETCCCMLAKWLVAVMIDDGRPGNIRELAWICGDHLADLPTLGFARLLFLLHPAGCSKLQHHLPSISYAAPTFDKLRWCCWYGPNSRSSGTC